jgi:hypothetical protein
MAGFLHSLLTVEVDDVDVAGSFLAPTDTGPFSAGLTVGFRQLKSIRPTCPSRVRRLRGSDSRQLSIILIDEAVFVQPPAQGHLVD